MSSVASARKFNLSLWLGFIFLGISLLVLFNLFGPVVREESRYLRRQVGSSNPLPPPTCPSADFVISIPQLGVCAKVIENVDPLDSSVYQRALTRGVAHAMGTGLPGEGNNIFLFAHSSGSPLDAARYNSIFYLLYKLSPGDPIELRRNGQVYPYRVESLAKVSSDAVSYLDPLSNGETLTLMTCWPPGTTLKRLIVVAKPDGI